MNKNYVTIDSILEEVNRIHIPGTYFNIEEIKEWVYRALSFINTKQANIISETIIEIKDYKGLIPADVEKIEKVIYIEGDKEIELHEILPYEESNTHNYEINAGYLYLYYETGKVKLIYYTIPVDSLGRPMIPDNTYYIKAIISFIRYKLGERAFWQNKILYQQFQMLEQEWYFYLPAAQSSEKMKITKDSRRFRKISNRYFL